MKIGDSVKINQNVIDEDFENIKIENCQGRIVEVEVLGEKDLILVEFDSITLKFFPESYILTAFETAFDYSQIIVSTEDVTLTQPRDTQEDVIKIQEELEQKYNNN